jgi:hypothetical protein
VSKTISSYRSRRTTSSERAGLLRAFERSGLSAAEFARQQRINYATFCGWRHHREAAAGAADSPAFVEVELSPSAVPAVPASSLVVEVGAQIRLRVSHADQVSWAAALLHQLTRQEEAC